LTLTIVDVFLLPAMLIITGFAIFAAYALGFSVLGVGLWLSDGRPMPEGLSGKFGLACLGACVAGLAWLVPVAGWFFVLGLTLLGIRTLAAFLLPNSPLCAARWRRCEGQSQGAGDRRRRDTHKRAELGESQGQRRGSTASGNCRSRR
jgi:hypothetical protein